MLNVTQTPRNLFLSPKHLLRTVEEKKADSMLYMLWYQQKDTAMVLIVLSYSAGSDPIYEDGFKDRFTLKRTETLAGVLKISNLSLSDSAVYYCAVSMHSAVVFITLLGKLL
uniref:Immunoglobulin V-set domain-containing protein n=1 Tax=Cyprinus carpio TaxID=7962 RepID=A0A8C2C6H9_CYPCA